MRRKKIPEIVFIKGVPYIRIDIISAKNKDCFEHAIKDFRKFFLNDMHERIANGEDILVREDKKHMQNTIKNMRLIENALADFWAKSEAVIMEDWEKSDEQSRRRID